MNIAAQFGGFRLSEIELLETINEALYSSGCYHPRMGNRSPIGKRVIDDRRYNATMDGAREYFGGMHRGIDPQLRKPPSI